MALQRQPVNAPATASRHPVAGAIQEAVASTKVVTGLARASYFHGYEPKRNDLNGKLQYSVSILIPKEDEDTVQKIEEAIQLAIQTKWPVKVPPNLKIPLRDGDTDRPDDENYAGHWFINANSEKQPDIVDRKFNKSIDPNEWGSGDYGHFSINLYAFDKSGSRGVAAGLNNVMFVKKGVSLSGRSTAAQDFAGISYDDEE